MAEKQSAIVVEHVSKDFLLPHQRATSIKSLVTRSYKKGGAKDAPSMETQHALRGINFEVREGEFFGIVGRNGSGKSTLLKILAGIYQPTKGRVMTRGKLVPFIELGVGFNAELTGRENVYLNGAMLGFSRKEIDAMYEEIVAFAELERFMDQKLKNYSSGMQVRLAFSMATRAQADILLVDEVLAVGDAAFQRKCFEYFKQLKADKKTVVFVTHDMGAVREYCDRVVLIDNSELKLSGHPEEVATAYSKLFMQDNLSSEGGTGERWGNGDVKIMNATAKLEGNHVVVRVEANVVNAPDKLQYGFHVTGQDGVEITAMNNRMLHINDVTGLVAGSTVQFEWHMLNIFNDGVYNITLTLVDDVSNILDWYVNVTSFKVRRAERSTTAVLPPITVETTVGGEK